MEGKLKFLRYVAYVIEILVLYVLCGTPNFMPSILGVKPVLLLPVALTIAVFESEIPAMLIGCGCGLLLDMGFGTNVGLYTLSLTILCFVLGYCARNFFVTNFANAMIIGVCSVLVLLCVHFLIYWAGADIADPWGHFLRHYLIKIFYTLIFLPPLYWFNRLFRSSMVEN